MKPRSRYIAHSSSFTHERRSSRARCSARRSRPGSCACGVVRRWACCLVIERQRRVVRAALRAISGSDRAVAKTTSARRARSIGARAPGGSAAGRTREEDHALCLAWHFRVVLHHDRLATTRGRVDCRNGGPHPLVELAAEFLDEGFVLLTDTRVALSEEDLSVAGLHAQQLHEGTDLMTGRS